VILTPIFEYRTRFKSSLGDALIELKIAYFLYLYSSFSPFLQ
jgi:hypothetical protein